MPELPEVETIRQELLKNVKGRRIIQIEVRLAKPLRDISKEEFSNKIKGSRIEEIKRRGKILIIELSGSYSLLIHLKLTGRLLYLPKEEEITKHTHIIFYLDNDMTLRFWDLRQFGYFKLIKSDFLSKLPEITQLGPEPLDSGFTQDEFRKKILSKRKGKIKPLLMNQTFIAGIGNLYADEICHLAGVRPDRDVSTLTEQEIASLYRCLRQVLPRAIKYRGSSTDQYRDLYNQPGEYHFQLKVYGRAGERCFNCNGIIQRIKLAGRSAHFCPYCQK